MARDQHRGPSRRAVVAVVAGLASLRPGPTPAQAPETSSAPAQGSAPAGGAVRELVARPATARLRPEPAPETEVWAFDGKLPGPELRIRHGEEVRLKLVNKTERP